ncbi:MAG: asparagine synthase-related protein [Clostridia bacterium]|nr:asparagine synthase-related protein [Clostridia bacterium]
MSAICGYINLKGNYAPKEIGAAMMKKLGVYSADASETWSAGPIFFGCHHQWITPESCFEKLPYHDETAGLTITADAIIDNRSELLGLFGIPLIEKNKITDSELILLAFKKWGDECPKYLIGDYAFAIWNHQKRELFCARDHVGKRTFYYVYSEGTFAFCTVMKPLLVVPQVTKGLNDLWLADFLAIPTVAHELEAHHTIYQDVFQLEPAQSMKVSLSGFKKKKYWHPLELPEIRFKNDVEYDEAFREIFFEAVHCRTRSYKDVGILLSGGLDSGAVACVASQQFKNNGKRLKAYSAVPIEGYVEFLPSGWISDESEYINAICEHCGNIDINYCRFPDRHSLTNTERLINILEQPYKIVENLFWMDGIAETAARQNCKVLLDGQFGNSTISFGDFYIQLFTLFKNGQWVKMLNEISDYGKFHGVSRKRLLQYVFKRFSPEFVQKNIFKQQGDQALSQTISLVQPDFAKQHHTEMRLKKAGYLHSPYQNYTLSEVRKLIFEPSAFTHIGAVETKLSLAYGIAKRDPTRDKRVIEFCFRIPGNQFVQKGQERYLVRRSMKDILPDKVRLNTKVRGKQSADWIQRIQPEWENARNELERAIQKDYVKRYINVSEIDQALMKNEVLTPGETNVLDLRLMLSCLIFSNFIKHTEDFLKGGDNDESMEQAAVN